MLTSWSPAWFLRAAFPLVLFTGPLFADPPASYSLAQHNLVTPVKNQGQLGTCWAFSSTTVFESSLVRQKFLSPEAAGNFLSEWDLATHHGVNLSLTYPYNNWGGEPQYAIAYFTRGFGAWNIENVTAPAGGGPVRMINTPLNAYPLKEAAKKKDLTPYLTPGKQPLAPYRLVQAIEFVDPDNRAGHPIGPKFRRKIKQAILRYGALVTNMNANLLTGSGQTINPIYDTYAYTGDSLTTDHDVTIVGWNDAVPVYDKDGTLLGTGAWLIQNSWGTKFANSSQAVSKPAGYFWLGYCDTAAVKYCAAFVAAQRNNVSDTVLQNQIFYWSAQAGAPKSSPTWAATRLVAPMQTKLAAIGLWTLGERCTVDLRIYQDGGPKGPAGSLLSVMKDVLLPERGYAEIPLSATLPLQTGEPLYIVVKFHAGIDRPVGVDTRSLLRAGLKNASHLSWVSLDGRHWSDLAGKNEKHPGIFFLKGILGNARDARTGSAVAQVTRVRQPLRTKKSFHILRGIASFNTTEVFYRLGSNGPVRSAQGTTAWTARVRGLQPGRNVVHIWPAAATGVSPKPLRVVILRD